MLEGEPYRPFEVDPNAKRSAVLVLLLDTHDIEESEVLLTLRSSNLHFHKGQISFPGGRCEQEETPEDTALREAAEETDLNSHSVKILGRLSELYIPPSNSVVTPVVGIIAQKPFLSPNETEVEEIFWLPLKKIIDLQTIRRETWTFGSQRVDVPFWNIGKPAPLWGATAMILSELLALFEI